MAKRNPAKHRRKDIEAMRKAAERLTKRAEIRPRPNPRRKKGDSARGSEFTIRCVWPGKEAEADMVEAWQTAEVDATERIEKARDHSKFIADLPANRVAAVTFLSDQHIAPGTPVDFRRMREDAELIADTRDVYAILGGDACDNHVKHLSAIIAARSQPSDQFMLFEHYLRILQKRILCVTSGNHELWNLQIAGVDMVSWICKANKLAYAPYEARILVNVGKQQYKIAIRHQFRMNSSFNQTHAVKQWLRLGEDEFDIGCIGHHHEAAIEQTVYRSRIVWACRPGAYQVTSAFSQQHGWNAAMPTCPTFLLFPDRHHIIGLHDVRDVPKILKVFNG